jgi:hypothetical protein
MADTRGPRFASISDALQAKQGETDVKASNNSAGGMPAFVAPTADPFTPATPPRASAAATAAVRSLGPGFLADDDDVDYGHRRHQQQQPPPQRQVAAPVPTLLDDAPAASGPRGYDPIGSHA